jgi:hypothetical protein
MKLTGDEAKMAIKEANKVRQEAICLLIAGFAGTIIGLCIGIVYPSLDIWFFVCFGSSVMIIVGLFVISWGGLPPSKCEKCGAYYKGEHMAEECISEQKRIWERV